MELGKNIFLAFGNFHLESAIQIISQTLFPRYSTLNSPICIIEKLEKLSRVVIVTLITMLVVNSSWVYLSSWYILFYTGKEIKHRTDFSSFMIQLFLMCKTLMLLIVFWHWRLEHLLCVTMTDFSKIQVIRKIIGQQTILSYALPH